MWTPSSVPWEGEALSLAVQAAEGQPQVNPWIVAISVMFATFMEVMDTTVVNVSLPHIAGSLSASVDEATWTLTSYLVSNAIILPMTGWLANYFGRKRLLMMSVTGFTLASLVCGLAPSLPVLVITRVIQGAAGGTLQPISQAILLEAFRPQDRGKAMAFWGLGIVVAPIMGPVLGGYLTDMYSWRWVFFINIPVGITSLIMTKAFVFDPEYIGKELRRIDYWGLGMLAVGMGSLQIMLDKGQEKDWFQSHLITALAVISIGAVVILIIRELKARDPVVDLQVFKKRTYSTGVFLMTTLGFVLYGSLVLVPILMQTILGYSAFEAGIAMAPRGFGSFLAMPVVGVLVGKFDPRKLLAMGFTLGALSLYQLSILNMNAGYWDFFWPQFIQGVGLALLFVPLTTLTMDPIANKDMGNATSIFNLLRNIGGSMGIAAATTYTARTQQKLINVLGEHVNPYSLTSQLTTEQIQSHVMSQGADPVTALHQTHGILFGMVHQQAALISFLHGFFLMGLIFICVLPVLFLMKKPEETRGAPPMH